MLYALKLRSVGRNDGKTASLAAVAGTMFLKSKEMAEEMYSAMECRGFTGTYRAADRLRWRAGDLALGAAVAAMVLAFFFVQGLSAWFANGLEDAFSTSRFLRG